MPNLPEIPVDQWLAYETGLFSDTVDKVVGAFKFRSGADDLTSTIPPDLGMPGYVSNQDELDRLMAEEERLRRQQAEQDQRDQQAQLDQMMQARQEPQPAPEVTSGNVGLDNTDGYSPAHASFPAEGGLQGEGTGGPVLPGSETTDQGQAAPPQSPVEAFLNSANGLIADRFGQAAGGAAQFRDAANKRISDTFGAQPVSGRYTPDSSSDVVPPASDVLPYRAGTAERTDEGAYQFPGAEPPGPARPGTGPGFVPEPGTAFGDLLPDGTPAETPTSAVRPASDTGYSPADAGTPVRDDWQLERSNPPSPSGEMAPEAQVQAAATTPQEGATAAPEVSEPASGGQGGLTGLLGQLGTHIEDAITSAVHAAMVPIRGIQASQAAPAEELTPPPVPESLQPESRAVEEQAGAPAISAPIIETAGSVLHGAAALAGLSPEAIAERQAEEQRFNELSEKGMPTPLGRGEALTPEEETEFRELQLRQAMAYGGGEFGGEGLPRLGPATRAGEAAPGIEQRFIPADELRRMTAITLPDEALNPPVGTTRNKLDLQAVGDKFAVVDRTTGDTVTEPLDYWEAVKQMRGARTVQDMMPPGPTAQGIVGEQRVVPPDVARALPVEEGLAKIPDEDFLDLKHAAESAGGDATNRGVELDLQRFQQPNLPGEDALRGGVFYSVKGGEHAEGYRAAPGAESSVGGSQEVAGPTLFKNPLVTWSRDTGGAPTGIQNALDVVGSPYTQRDIVEAVGNSWTGEGGRVESIARILKAAGGDPSVAGAIVEKIPVGETKYTVAENIIANRARQQGYDGWIKLKDRENPTIFEVMDFREGAYPHPGGAPPLTELPKGYTVVSSAENHGLPPNYRGVQTGSGWHVETVDGKSIGSSFSSPEAAATYLRHLLGQDAWQAPYHVVNPVGDVVGFGKTPESAMKPALDRLNALGYQELPEGYEVWPRRNQGGYAVNVRRATPGGESIGFVAGGDTHEEAVANAAAKIREFGELPSSEPGFTLRPEYTPQIESGGAPGITGSGVVGRAPGAFASPEEVARLGREVGGPARAGLSPTTGRVLTGAAQGAVGGGYEASQQEGATPESVARAALAGAAGGAVRSALGTRAGLRQATSVLSRAARERQSELPEMPPTERFGATAPEVVRRTAQDSLRSPLLGQLPWQQARVIEGVARTAGRPDIETNMAQALGWQRDTIDSALLSNPAFVATRTISSALSVPVGMAAKMGESVFRGVRTRDGKPLAEVPAQLLGAGIGLLHGASSGLVSATAGLTGNPLRTTLQLPRRVLHQFPQGFTQEFWRSVSYGPEAAQIASREGLTPMGPQWWGRVTDLIDNPTREMIDSGNAFSQRMTFTNQPGPAGQLLQKVQRAPIIGNLLAPYATIPTNILSRGLDMVPGIGQAAMALDLGRRAAATGAQREMLPGVAAAVSVGGKLPSGVIPLNEKLAWQAAGLLGFGWAYNLVASGGLTGSGPSDPNANADMRAKRPNDSLMVGLPGGASWFVPLRVLGPVGSYLKIIADYAEAGIYDNKDMTSQAESLVKRMSSVLAQQSGWSGLLQLASMIQDPQRSLAQFLGGTAREVVPYGGALTALGRVNPTGEPDVERSPGSAARVGIPEYVRRSVAQELPTGTPLIGGRGTVPPTQNVLGQQVPVEQAGPLGLIAPRGATQGHEQPVIDLYRGANVDISASTPKDIAAHDPVAGIPTPPRVPLTEAEGQTWQRYRGEALQQMTAPLLSSPTYAAMSSALKEKELRALLTRADEAATRRLRGDLGAVVMTSRIGAAVGAGR